MTNPFEAYGETQISAPVKRKIFNDEKRAIKAAMKLSPVEQKLADQAKLLSHYQKWRREVRDVLIKKNGKEVVVLLRMLRSLKPSTIPDMVEHVVKAEWLKSADWESRFATLSFIDSALVRCNIRDGRPPFDDPLPDEPDGPFQILKKLLIGNDDAGHVDRRHGSRSGPDVQKGSELSGHRRRHVQEVQPRDEPQRRVREGRPIEEAGAHRTVDARGKSVPQAKAKENGPASKANRKSVVLGTVPLNPVVPRPQGRGRR